MSSRRKNEVQSVSQFDDNFTATLIWIARMILKSHIFQTLSGLKRLDDEVKEALGLEKLDSLTAKVSDFHEQVKEALEQLEAKPALEPSLLHQNSLLLKKTFGFSDMETEIFIFIAAANVYPKLCEVVEMLSSATPEQIIRSIAAATGFAAPDVRMALSPESPLGSAGLVRVGKSGPYDDSHPFKLIDHLVYSIPLHHANTESLLSKCFRKSKETSLSLRSFSHIGEQVDILQRYLARCLEAPRPGVNILLYGAPGVGKTELARVMAKSLDASLYEVLVHDFDGDARSKEERLSNYRLCQRVLKNQPRSIVLFDEVEDVFPAEPSLLLLRPGLTRTNKGYMVNQLENSPVPSIWIANQISQIDNAYLRRFDLLFEIKVPPRPVRERILAQKFSALAVRPEWIDKISKAEQLTPSDVDRAAKVLAAIGGQDMTSNEKLTEKILKSNLGARRLSLASPRSECGDGVYDLRYLNTTEDTNGIAEGLSRQLRGSVLLYGAPGTGKTAFARHIGELAKRPLLTRRASDLLDMYVGGTEARIARMFQEAESEESILLLDEADSFFRDRRMARNSWEVTQVNELLIQMESFSGLFICSTNLMDNLDQAVFRRFALKVRFDYPREAQRWELFLAHAKELELIQDENSTNNCRVQVDRLSYLAPGDFSTVRRKHELLGHLTSLEALVEALTEECKIKPDAREDKKIGFG